MQSITVKQSVKNCEGCIYLEKKEHVIGNPKDEGARIRAHKVAAFKCINPKGDIAGCKEYKPSYHYVHGNDP